MHQGGKTGFLSSLWWGVLGLRRAGAALLCLLLSRERPLRAITAQQAEQAGRARQQSKFPSHSTTHITWAEVST